MAAPAQWGGEDDEALREEQLQSAVQFDDRLLGAVQFLTDPMTQNASLEDRKK
jgi:hypothetical protein